MSALLPSLDNVAAIAYDLAQIMRILNGLEFTF